MLNGLKQRTLESLVYEWIGIFWGYGNNNWTKEREWEIDQSSMEHCKVTKCVRGIIRGGLEVGHLQKINK